jgi:hypothetical protein
MTVAVGVRTPREQQDIALPLVIPFGMEMFNIFAQRSSGPPEAEIEPRVHAELYGRPQDGH